MTPYTETEIEFIAGLLQSGASSGQIAAHFEGRSRNAIVGIVYRNAKLKAIGFANKPNGNRGGGRKKMAEVDKAPRRAKVNARLPGVLASPKPPAPYHLPGRMFLQATDGDQPEGNPFDLRVRQPKRLPWDGTAPQSVAMRFIDCLPDADHPARCRTPIDLTIGGETGPDMLVCGAMVEPGMSSCPHCRARLYDRIGDKRAA